MARQIVLPFPEPRVQAAPQPSQPAIEAPARKAA